MVINQIKNEIIYTKVVVVSLFGDHALSYKGCHSGLNQKILLMFVRGIGVRDIAEMEQVSTRKVLSVLLGSNRTITPKQLHYDHLEVDECWCCVGNKKNKIWLIYAYHL